MIGITGTKKRATYSKYGKALDNFFMVFQPDNSKLQHAEPNPEILQELDQIALKFNMKSENAKEFGTSAFKAVSREKMGSYFIKHDGANRSYNPKYEFVKARPAAYTISKTDKERANRTQSQRHRPQTAKANYYEKDSKNNREEDIEIIEEKPEEKANILNTNGLRRIESAKENLQTANINPRGVSAKSNASNRTDRVEKKVFACVDFNKQTLRKPFNFVSSCRNEHNFENFQMGNYTGKKVLNFKQYLNRKTYLCDDAKFELPDKFYLNNFNWAKIYPEKSKCFINFDRFREKNNQNLETKTYLNSSVDVKNLPEMYPKLAHFKRLPSPNFNKILGRNEAKILKERVAGISGYRPKSAFGKYSNVKTDPNNYIL